MRQTRNILALLLLGVGVLGSFRGAVAQERRPWPPRPVTPPEDAGLLSAGGATPRRTVLKAKGSEGVVVTNGTSDGDTTKLKRADLSEAMPPPLPVPTVVRPAEKPDVPAAEQDALPLPTPPPLPAPANDLLPPALPGPTKVKLPPPGMDPLKTVIKEPVQQLPAPTPKVEKKHSPRKTITMPAPDLPPDLPRAAVEKPVAPVQATPSESAAKPRPFVLVKPKRVAEAPPKQETPPAPPPASGTASRLLPPVGPTPPAVPPSVGPGAALLDLQAPQVTVEKRGPAQPKPGEAVIYQYVVRNVGPAVAQQVRVEDTLPADVKLLAAEPHPLFDQGRVVWTLPALPPGGERILKISLYAAKPGDWQHKTTVHVTAAGSIQPRTAQSIPPDGLTLRLTTPTGVQVGKQAAFELTYTNQTRLTLNALTLQAHLSDGLRHPAGQHIEADVGGLEPGASRTVKVQATAAQPGRQQLKVRLTTPAGLEATGSAVLDVAPEPRGLGVRHLDVPRAFVGRESELRLEVVNQTGAPLRNVSVLDTLPEGVEFAGASDRGLYQPLNRGVHWLLDDLAPGQAKVLTVRVVGKTAGKFQNEAVVRVVGQPDARTTSPLAVESVTDLSVQLVGENALEQGKETVYEVRIDNPGRAPATGVAVQFTFSEGLVPRNAQGPGRFRVEGQTVTFEGLPTLNARGHAVYRVLALGQSAGDRRVRVAVVSEQVRTPLLREKQTRVYRD